MRAVGIVIDVAIVAPMVNKVFLSLIVAPLGLFQLVADISEQCEPRKPPCNIQDDILPHFALKVSAHRRL